MKLLLSLVCCAAMVLTGCVQSIAVSTMGGLLDDGFQAFTEESDLAFAEQAFPGSLKLLEVMLRNDPDNAKLLKLASEGYSSYALGFMEDTQPERARVFYLRGRDYGLRLLRKNSDIARALDGTPDDLSAALAKADADDVPAAFWAGFGWGSFIYLSLTSPDAIADLPRAEALMKFVAACDSSYYFAGADVFLGTLYGGRPKILGGNPEISKRSFERAIRLTGGKFLMTYVYYARSYAVQIQDEALFEELLTTVDKASLDILPEFRLANAIAKKKAHILLSKKSDLF